jgi:hypothetical protein
MGYLGALAVGARIRPRKSSAFLRQAALDEFVAEPRRFGKGRAAGYVQLRYGIDLLERLLQPDPPLDLAYHDRLHQVFQGVVSGKASWNGESFRGSGMKAYVLESDANGIAGSGHLHGKGHTPQILCLPN